MTLILGIDPGSRITGYGLIEVSGKNIACIECGVIKVRNATLSDQTHFDNLHQIFRGLTELLTRHNPMEVAIEQVFVNARNVNSALKLGQARGAALAAIGATLGEIKIFEYATRYVKKAVVGYGAASKEQIQHMVKMLLNLPKIPTEDASDALAVAVCHAHTKMNCVTNAKIVGASKMPGKTRRGSVRDQWTQLSNERKL